MKVKILLRCRACGQELDGPTRTVEPESDESALHALLGQPLAEHLGLTHHCNDAQQGTVELVGARRVTPQELDETVIRIDTKPYRYIGAQPQNPHHLRVWRAAGNHIILSAKMPHKDEAWLEIPLRPQEAREVALELRHLAGLIEQDAPES